MTFKDQPVKSDGLEIYYGEIGEFVFQCQFKPDVKAGTGKDLVLNIEDKDKNLEIGGASWDGTAAVKFYTDENFSQFRIHKISTNLTISCKPYFRKFKIQSKDHKPIGANSWK